MSNSWHAEAEIIAVLKQVEAGRKAEDVARDSHFPTAPATTERPPPSRLTVRMSYYDVCGIWGQVSFKLALSGV
jgi:hypothetical protein